MNGWLSQAPEEFKRWVLPERHEFQRWVPPPEQHDAHVQCWGFVMASVASEIANPRKHPRPAEDAMSHFLREVAEKW